MLRYATGDLPIPAFREKLDSSQQQFLIPFLGAGASLLGDAAKAAPEIKHQPTAQEIDDICAKFEISENTSKLFVAVALQLAQLTDPLVRRKEQTADRMPLPIGAPSSWELASLLTRKLQELTKPDGYVYEPFERYADQLLELLPQDPTQDAAQRKANHLRLVRVVAELLNLHRSIPELLTIASYFAPPRRDTLRFELRQRFEGVTTATKIQKCLTEKASRFVATQNKRNVADKPDYLVITTNYDCLMEQQLDAAHVPACVVTVGFDRRIAMEFGNAQEYLGLASDKFEESVKKKYMPNTVVTSKEFAPAKKQHSLAMVYKIHGCPKMDATRDSDNIVIADRDYVRFMQTSGSNGDLIPVYIRNRIRDSRLLFLGYSFSDWNVRGLYEQFLEGRTRASSDRDYVVTRSYGKTDDLFFKKWNDLSVFITDLDSFADKIA